jgi:hypothetical protein
LVHTSNRSSLATHPRLWLAAVEGARRPHPHEAIHPVDQPEAMLEIEFIGLTDEEQRHALTAFPGGRRFILKSQPH